MAGLIDGLLNDDTFRLGMGLLAAGSARSDGAGTGQRLMEGLGYLDKYRAGKKQSAFDDLKMQQAQAEIEAQKRKLEQETQLRSLVQKFQGKPALSPLMGDTSSGILPSAGSPATGFDFAGYANAVAGVDPMASLSIQQQLQKENPINKLDVRDFTPASVEKFKQSKNYGDLVRLDKVHFANTGGSTMALDPFTGQPLNSIPNTQSPESKASNAVSWANYGLSKDRLAFDKAGGADANKPNLLMVIG